ncbi:class I SAM-dependent methyltransferase [Clostridiaceae bacterium M8S5]|nr:class I SAM-dependent methyltransferase [Clostridiaceae bacterium M8S5]
MHKQQGHNINEEAWNKESYNAWVTRFGEPSVVAEKIKNNPSKLLSVLGEEFIEVNGKKIMNLMGSCGNKAVALALMGADVSIVDFSYGNKLYALELAKEAGVSINYILSDVLNLSQEVFDVGYDIVFAEMGILHYFSDLHLFFNTVYKLLDKGGLFILRDFHPVSTKLITSRGTTAKIRKHKVSGDYFSSDLVMQEVSYSKHLKEEDKKEKVMLRKWTLGEIISGVAKEGLRIMSLKERPNLSCANYDKGIPKTFTVTAVK